MLKRVLHQVISDDDENSDEDQQMTEKQRRRLQNKFIPGAVRPSSGKNKESRQEDHSGDDSDDDSDATLDSEEYDSDLDDQPAWPAPCEVDRSMPGTKEKKQMQFRCALCPDKRLKSQQDLDIHLKSKQHLKIARELGRAEEIGLEAYQKECLKRAQDRQETEGSAKEKREAKKQKYLLKKKEAREALKKKRQNVNVGGGGAISTEQLDSKENTKIKKSSSTTSPTSNMKNAVKKTSAQLNKLTLNSTDKIKNVAKGAKSKTKNDINVGEEKKENKSQQKRQRLSEEELIALKKQKFAQKKARRLARKQQEAAGENATDDSD